MVRVVDRLEDGGKGGKDNENSKYGAKLIENGRKGGEDNENRQRGQNQEM